MNVKLYHGDCLEVMGRLDDDAVALVFVDPPYNIGIFKKMETNAYLEWCEKWIALCSRKLKPNGAFWVSHSKPNILVDISRIIEQYGRKRINWVTWDKYSEAEDLQGFMDGYTVIGNLRSFQVMAEYLIYHADEGEWTTQCDQEQGFIFEPLRAYLAEEWKRAGLNRQDMNRAIGTASTGGGMASHYLGKIAQWKLPTEQHYHALRQYANAHNRGDKYLRREYEDLRREYEDLRREYEDLRYTFNNPGKVSSVWQFPPAPKNGHPTPKPMMLLERIIEATSNEGDLILDPMMGSGTTGVVCANTNRDFIGIEIDVGYFEIAERRIEHAQTEMVQGEMQLA